MMNVFMLTFVEQDGQPDVSLYATEELVQAAWLALIKDLAYNHVPPFDGEEEGKWLSDLNDAMVRGNLDEVYDIFHDEDVNNCYKVSYKIAQVIGT
jgi:hypothetical protein